MTVKVAGGTAGVWDPGGTVATGGVCAQATDVDPAMATDKGGWEAEDTGPSSAHDWGSIENAGFPHGAPPGTHHLL